MVVVGQADTVAVVTVIVPVAYTGSPQPPVKRILYSKVPAAVGVPEIVITSADHVAVTPLGKPEPVVSIPVAPVVAIVISVKAVFTTSVGDDDGAAAVFAVHDEFLRQRTELPTDLLKLLPLITLPLALNRTRKKARLPSY